MVEERYVLKKSDITDPATAGYRACALASLSRAEFPVPDFFVVSARAYEAFFEAIKDEINSVLAAVDYSHPESFTEASRKIMPLIMEQGLDEKLQLELKDAYEELSLGKDVKAAGGRAVELINAGGGSRIAVVVRLSPLLDYTHYSFAGQAESVLNVIGLGMISEALRRCWASLFTARALAYRNLRGIAPFLSAAAIVQKMIHPERAGVTFTTNPLTPSTILIESSWGLGETVSRGMVVPDEYVIDKRSGNLISKTIAQKLWARRKTPETSQIVTERVTAEKREQETLDDSLRSQLLHMAQRAEHSMGLPLRIEWCEERGRIHLITAEPLVTATRSTEVEADGDLLLQGIPASPGTVKGPVSKEAQEHSILVTTNLSAEVTPYLSILTGIIAESGCKTSHAASLCREFGIPSVVRAAQATAMLSEAQEIILDATTGKIFGRREATPHTHPESTVPLSPDEPMATKILLNITAPGDFDVSMERVDGIGLFSLESRFKGQHPAYLAREHPDHFTHLLEEAMENAAQALHPKPLYYRFLDIRSDEFRDAEGSEEEAETNPALGWRGTRRMLDEAEVLQCELTALRNLHKKGFSNIAVVIPYLASVSELAGIKKQIDFPIKTGIMIETPAAAIEIEQFCAAGIDFVCIGVDSLVQLVLGIDKENARVSWLYSETNPSALKLIRHVITTCKRHGIATTVNGEGGNSPELARELVAAGIDAISCNPEYFEEIHTAVAREEKKLLLDKKRE